MVLSVQTWFQLLKYLSGVRTSLPQRLTAPMQTTHFGDIHLLKRESSPKVVWYIQFAVIFHEMCLKLESTCGKLNRLDIL